MGVLDNDGDVALSEPTHRSKNLLRFSSFFSLQRITSSNHIQETRNLLRVPPFLLTLIAFKIFIITKKEYLLSYLLSYYQSEFVLNRASERIVGLKGEPGGSDWVDKLEKSWIEKLKKPSIKCVRVIGTGR